MSGHGEVVFSGTWGHEESVNDPDTVRVFRSDDQPPFGLRLDICKHRTADGWRIEAFMAADPLDGVPVTPENLRRMARQARHIDTWLEQAARHIEHARRDLSETDGA